MGTSLHSFGKFSFHFQYILFQSMNRSSSEASEEDPEVKWKFVFRKYQIKISINSLAISYPSKSKLRNLNQAMILNTAYCKNYDNFATKQLCRG